MLLIVFWAIFFFHEQTYIGAVNHFGKKKKKNKIKLWSASAKGALSPVLYGNCAYILFVFT